MLQRLLLPLASAAAQQQHQQLCGAALLVLPSLGQQPQHQHQQLCGLHSLRAATHAGNSSMSPPGSPPPLPLLLRRPAPWQQPQPQHHQPHQQLQQAAAYSQRPGKLNPKEQKRHSKTDKRALKKSAVPQSSATAGDSAASFSEEVQAMEPDVTRLVLQAIHNVTPVLDVRTIRSATNVNYVPGLMPPRKARSLALHWLVKAADARSNGSKASYAECLALELLLAYQKRGTARQKRDDLHKLALQNRANVHLRWW